MEIAAFKASLSVDLSLGLVEMRVHECDKEWFVGMLYGSRQEITIVYQQEVMSCLCTRQEITIVCQQEVMSCLCTRQEITIV